MIHKPIILSALLLAHMVVFADSPMPPPSLVTVCTTSNSICANSDPKSGVTTVVSRVTGKELWSIPGWHRWMFISVDGQSLAIGYAGMNLVPTNSELKLKVMDIYNQGRLVRSLSLADLYESSSQLKLTASHSAWVETVRVNRANQLVLELVTGRAVAFSMTTGEEQAPVNDGV